MPYHAIQYHTNHESTNQYRFGCVIYSFFQFILLFDFLICFFFILFHLDCHDYDFNPSLNYDNTKKNTFAVSLLYSKNPLNMNLYCILNNSTIIRYKAQSDVLRELESRLKQQMKGQRARLGNQSSTASSTTNAHKQALLKLERDFERVQSTVVATKSKVTKQQKQYQQRGAAASAARQQQEEVDAANNANNHPNSAQQKLQQQQLVLQQDRLQEEIMKEREAEIRQINKGMHQVNEIYKDLAHIVGEQQEMVDGIETKMEDTKTSAQAGLEQISKANDKYSGGGKGGDSGCVIS
mmetsp:Transcript_46253/g.46941  ORF Transcript_46253/g.46941 Transcript_46253/m.46941 type:complete len:295 (-) Transcript_46253:420-1304(-)